MQHHFARHDPYAVQRNALVGHKHAVLPAFPIFRSNQLQPVAYPESLPAASVSQGESTLLTPQLALTHPLNAYAMPSQQCPAPRIHIPVPIRVTPQRTMEIARSFA